MEPILTLDSIHTFIGQFHILEGVTLSVPRESITVLLGRNGAGKTTTLKSIIGLTPPRHGKVIFDGIELRGKRAYDIANLGIGYVPEHRAIFRNLSVLENLKIAEKKRGDLDRKADFIFSLFPDLKRLYRLPGNHLSGGQQQMLAVARALVADNKLLLIDEPSEGLAPILIEQMMEAIKELSKTTTILLVEQNFIMASQLGEFFYIIDDGKTVENGLMSELVNNQDLVKEYLGVSIGKTGGVE
ncbi:MAG TPA: ABC transporter ATP-binding protein [Anaerolineaceae bacterium]|jgi:branched-chain amino acid transport system ATP-binding protein|nr:ABC transporter ATP-binding protein [Anaerolineaceae bacterium]HOH20970.1 ABC transporter ATP-binding protein [Anaerolineaceae bacterium]HOU44702.1 ABC transporter ATP-binding protein [Anaerolineaceae bacterium]HQF46505.1 ABC transporter ATP-binding protein [Anaerolineaceae bacterium]HQH36381.1 ABC transporter ATP-binding protein [Anaerolineaceae bacterium]